METRLIGFRRDIWPLFELLLVMVSYVLVCYLAAFDNRIQNNIATLVVLYSCDLLYLFDTIWRIVLFKKGKMKKRIKVYKTISFLIDFLSIIPVELLVLIYRFNQQTRPTHEVISNTKTYLLAFCGLRVNRILRLYRVGAYYYGISKEIRLPNVYRRKIYFETFVCFFSCLVILFHFIASLWYLLNCEPIWKNTGPRCYKRQNLNNSIYANHPYYSHVNQTIGDAFGWYVGALHWTVMSLRNSGNRYTLPDEAFDMLISSLIMLFGYMMCMVITVFLIYFLNELDLRRSIFFHEAYAVKSFVKHFDLSKSVARFSDSSFNFMWRRKRGYSDHGMKQILPKTVQTEIGMCVMQGMLETSELLKCLPASALEFISLEAVLKHFFANEFLIRPNTMVHSAFFIVSGKVEVLSESDGVSSMLMLAKGSLIAERNLIYPSIRKYGVKTRTACDILVVNSHSVTRFLAEFPQINAKMHSILKERKVWIKTKIRERNLELKNIETENVQNLENGSPVKSEEKLTDRLSNDPKFHPTKKEPHITKSVQNRRAMGIQFMSVLTWLSFLRELPYAKKKSCGTKYDNIYKNLDYKWRSVASVRMYNILPLDDTPNYIFRRCVISKDSLVYRVWEMFIMVFVLIVSILYPIELAFNDRQFCWYVNLVTDLIYGLDLLLRLFVFYELDEISPLVFVTSHLLHEIRMLSIAVDVIPCIPFHLLSYVLNLSRREYNYLRISINIKFVRVIMMFTKFENDVRVRILTIRFCKNIVYISLYILWIASVFYILGCGEFPTCYDNPVETWVTANVKNGTLANYQFIDGTDSVFSVSLYWAICTTYGIGFNDIILKTRSETVSSSLGLLLGFCLVTYFYADLSSTLSGALENAIHHQDNTIWLTRYLNDALIDLRLIDRVNNYLNVQWQVLRGISSEAHRRVGFLTVSHSMYMELVVDYVADFLFRIELFKHLDTDTMRKFCVAAKLAVVPPNEVIINSGDFIRRMYVIRRGFVQVYLGESTTTVGVLVPGNSFGELNMFFGTPSHVTLKTMTYLEVIILDNTAFDRILPSTLAYADIIYALRHDSAGKADFESKFELVKERKFKKRRSHQSQLTNRSTFVYKKVIKNSKGELVHLRQHPNNPYDIEFNRLIMFRFLRFFFMPLTFLPKSRVIRCWEFFRVCSIVVTVVLVPLVEAFPNVKNEIEVWVYILDVITFADVYIRLHTAYRDPSDNNLVTHPLLAAKNYISSACLIDVIGSLPVYAIINYLLRDSPYEAKVWAYLLKLNRLILVYRVYGYYKFKSTKIIKGNTLKLLKLFSLLAYHAHLIGCVLALATCPATQSNPDPKPRCAENSWIMHSKSPRLAKNESLNDIDIYVISFYYISTTAMGCGFGDFHPYNQDERILTSILFFLYLFLRTDILVNVVGDKCHIDHKLLGYQKQMNYLVRFLSRERLDKKLTSRIIRYYEYQWKRTQGIEPQKLFANLFPSLRKEVAMDVFEDVMRQLPELKRVPSSFLRAICVYLTPIYFLRHDIIVQKDDVCDYIYFISRGRVLESREKGEVILEVGDYIGVMDLSTIHPIYKYTAAAVTNVDIFGMRRKDFVRIASYYPPIAKRFSGLAGFQGDKKGQSKDVSTDPRDDHDDESDILKEIRDTDIVQQSLSKIVALVIEQEKKEEKVFDGDIVYSSSVLLDSKLYRYLNITSFFAAVLSTSLATYQWSFQEYHYAVFAIGYLMDIVYIVRMGLRFRTSFFNSTGDLVSEISEIKNKYLSDPHGFALDFISTFPFEMFVGSLLLGGPSSEEHTKYMKRWWVNLRVNRVLRLIHVWFFFVKRTNVLSGNLLRAKLERLTCFTLLYFHFLACILHGFSRMGSFTSTKNCRKAKTEGVQYKWACEKPARWFQTKRTNDDYDHSSYAPYIWSMYFVLSTFTTTAYGDILPVTSFEMILISFIALSSLIWLGLSLSDILSAEQTTLDTSYHLAADVVLKLYQDYGVSPPIIQKTIRYFTFAWTRNKGVIVPEFLQSAPTSLKMDICIAAYGVHFRTGYLFRKLPEEFVRQATIRIRHFWVLEGDYVVRQNEIDSNLYFIHRGYVQCTKETVHEDQRSVMNVGYLGKSSFIGEVQCLIGPEPHGYSYKAQCQTESKLRCQIAHDSNFFTEQRIKSYMHVVNVDVVSLSSADFQELFELFPQHKTTLVRRILARKKARGSTSGTLGKSYEDSLSSEWNLRNLMLRETETITYDSD